MEITRFSLGSLRSNCYIVSEEKRAFIIDPGYESDEVLKYIKKNELQIEAIYITHGHPDHVGGVKQLKDTFMVPVYAPLKDRIWMGKSSYNQIGYEIPVDTWVRDLDHINLLDHVFTVYEVPGHSEGSTVLHTDHILFSGDTLFFKVSVELISLFLILNLSFNPSNVYMRYLMKIPSFIQDTEEQQILDMRKKFNPFVREE